MRTRHRVRGRPPARPNEATAGKLLRRIAKVSGAEQVLQITDRPHLRGGFLPLPGGGPIFVWWDLNHTQMPPLEDWELEMGDIELFWGVLALGGAPIRPVG